MNAKLAAIAGAAAMALAAAAACSLSLDPPLEAAPSPGADAGDGAAAPADGGGDAGASDGGPIKCTSDLQCRSDNACVASRCDLTTGRCVFDLCPHDAGACVVDRCDLETNSCIDRFDLSTEPVVKTFKIPTSKPFAQLRCGSASRCVALSHPYLFASIDDAVLAYGIADPHPLTPPRVLAVDGLRSGSKPVRPTAVVASGTRVYFVGEIQPDLSLPVGWVDVPPDPFATSISARTFVLPSVLGGTLSALPAPGGDLVLVVNAGANRQTYRVSVGSGIVGAPRNGSGNARSVAVSGARVVLADVVRDALVVSLEPIPPSTGAVIDAGSVVGDGGAAILPAQSYATGDDGQVLLATAVGDDAGAQRVRLARLFTRGSDTKIQGDPPIDLVSYPSPPILARVVGPAVWVSSDLAVVAALVPDDTSQTALAASVVHVDAEGALTVDPPRWTLDPLAAGPDGGASATPTASTLLSAQGLAYWVWQRGVDTTVSVLAPRCN
ncbi:MAG: hypothetical protein JNL38_08410 [Myxococcales bacterium]|nr:hypothetical protein [Myxococcales bacterium]